MKVDLTPEGSMDFYVYEHWRSDKGVCFYVGKGNGDRAWRFKRSRYYNNVVAKLLKNGHTVEVKILKEKMTEDEAFSLEMERICYWKSVGVRLTNLTDGGEGVRGKRHGRIMKSVLARPEVKARHSLAVKNAHARPETKQRHRDGCRKAQSQPDVRCETSKRMVKLRANQTAEKARIGALKATLNTPESRQKKRQIRIEVLSRPGMREKITARIREAMKKPSVRAKLGNSTRNSRWIHNGQEKKRLKIGEPLPEGWYYGTKPRLLFGSVR